MTSSDPNVTTTETGETVVLEPGDEGYIEPRAANDMPPAPHAEGAALSVDLPVEQAEVRSTEGEVPPQDLRLQSAEGQDNSEAIVMNRGLIVESTSPSDIVPNTPQIRPFPTEALEEPVVEDAPPEGETQAEEGAA